MKGKNKLSTQEEGEEQAELDQNAGGGRRRRTRRGRQCSAAKGLGGSASRKFKRETRRARKCVRI